MTATQLFSIRNVVVAISAQLCLLAGASVVSASPDLALPKAGVCADRGASETHPENTLAALREAVLLGTQMVVIDIARTADGHLILMRDETVDRTTNGSGAVAELTLDEVKQLDAGSWKSSKFKDHRVPTFDEALAALPHNLLLRLHVGDDVDIAKEVAERIVEKRRTAQSTVVGTKNARDAARLVATEISTLAVDDLVTAKDADQLRRLLGQGKSFPLVADLKKLLPVADDLGIERLTPAFPRGRTEAPSLPVFKGGEAQEVPAFSDRDQWIHHDLWVETEFDSDRDGMPDRMHVSVSRQRQTDTEGLKVPVVYVSSPYFSGTASGNRNFFWDPRQELNSKPPAHDPPPAIDFQRRRLIISKSHWNDWIPRGFAVVHSASPGTGLSQGCPTIGADNESLGPKAVVDWLCGRAKGFTLPEGGREVRAYWSSGKIGMTGTSYNGTIPLATATTGVAGLKAIIPVAPNTSYYHYYRSNGLVRHPGGFIGEDVDVLYNFINSGDPETRDDCNMTVRDTEMANGFDRKSGDYNDFWAGRDYLNDMGPMKCALLMAHAFNDWNVMPEHSVRIYEAAKRKGLPVQCYFHQGGHGGPPPLKMMNRWFTRYLYDVANDVEKDPRAWVVRERTDRQKPTPYSDYPNPESKLVNLRISGDGRTCGQLQIDEKAKQSASADSNHQTFVDDFNVSATELAKAPSSSHRLLFSTPILKDAVHFSGTCHLSIRLACSEPACNFSVYLLSLPWTEGADVKIYDNIITRGWADPQNRESLSRTDPLVPGEFYEISFALQPDDQVIPAGQQLALMIFSSDRDHTLWPEPGTEVTIDLDATTLSIPIVGGKNALRSAAFAPDVN